jgi:cellulase (glycosyl hydrolase family 5)
MIVHPSNSITRRAVLQLGIAGAAGLPLGGKLLAEPSAQTKPSLHVYPSYGWLRGFNVVPSWGARIEDAWWNYDPGRFREEVALARTVHANCLRLWIEFTAWMADPERITANFLDAVTAIDAAGMKTMPCLFNRWHDSQYDYGGTYLENLRRGWPKPHRDYVGALVAPLADDDRILIWDLCNEPQAGAPWTKETSDQDRRAEHDWLAAIAQFVRESGARQPITVGTMMTSNIEAFADLCDVLCAHPYARDAAGLMRAVNALQALSQKHGKPLLVNECLPGSLDDAKRAALAKESIPILAGAGFGWMGWALREGRAISTRRDRYDGNGIASEGFHPFFKRDGSLRAGLEFLRERPQLRAPWEKA